jgi:rhodanese-related sulfurtransferase
MPYARPVRPEQADGVSAVAAVELVRSGALLLDVREDHEWAAGHAPEAVHLPMSRFADGAQNLPSDRTIVCVCHVGARSAAVATALSGAGWQAINLIGGMEAWLAAGLPVVTDQGRPGSVG